ncbi:hypothetical protein [Noviherbaspirillum galbum]|uniref:Uncharacterized protein n=1 Tax=Noviherbaspirillum galbum TaxID=2709383 RepID=A0A6B3STK2_9BURK|nr:hypothetical protein [Noviherbaspirillum galbum]NEX63961.1 hypothetical protein [Noviherbaspirillum galbum]
MLSFRSLFHASNRDMPFVTAAIALTAFFSSLLVALLMVADGQPAFLAIWSVLAFLTMKYVRAHRKWRGSFERIYAPGAMPAAAARQFRHAGKSADAEEVSFREVVR